MDHALVCLAQSRAFGGLAVCVVWVTLLVLFGAGAWATNAKAGQPGWGAIVPGLNLYFLCRIAGRPGWWLILFFVPIVGLIVTVVVSVDLARSFGRGVLFGIGLVLLPFVFYPILGFGADQYQGPQIR